jgi:hypothetical protein
MGNFNHATGMLNSILIQLSQIPRLSLNKQFTQSVYDRFLRGLILLDEGKWTVDLESHGEVYLSSISFTDIRWILCC